MPSRRELLDMVRTDARGDGERADFDGQPPQDEPTVTLPFRLRVHESGEMEWVRAEEEKVDAE